MCRSEKASSRRRSGTRMSTSLAGWKEAEAREKVKCRCLSIARVCVDGMARAACRYSL